MQQKAATPNLTAVNPEYISPPHLHLRSTNRYQFEEYYAPLHALIRAQNLDGLDLDVEEEMSLAGIIRLIDRLRTDFGPSFLITLAPVATALIPNQKHLSGFDYRALETARGHQIAWYNTQFYCGWGDASTMAHYAYIIGTGWDAQKVVLGLVTNPGNGAGFVVQDVFDGVVAGLRARYPRFGGVMGWEYFNSLPGGEERPWEWAACMARSVRSVLPPPSVGGAFGSMPQVPIAPAHPYPAESVQTLKDLGFSQQAAVAALNMTGGNVEYAAGLLFQD